MPVQYGRYNDGSTEISVSLTKLTIDDTGFLINGDGHRLIWIPAHLRGNKIFVHLSTPTVVIGGDSGAITIIHFSL